MRPALAIIDSDLRIKLSMAEPNVLAHSCPAVDPYQGALEGGPALGTGAPWALALTMLALVMTKERAGVMAKPSILPLRCCGQRGATHHSGMVVAQPCSLAFVELRAFVKLVRGSAAATSGRGDHHVINRRMNIGDAMMLGRGRCREGDAKNNCSRKRNFCLAEHFYLLVELWV